MRTILATLALLASAALAQVDTSGRVVILDVKGPIGPAASDYVERGLATAAERGAEVVVLRMDTPGGLDTSMRAIVRAILASPVPVVSYVAPSGARAASAGTFISYASHVAAMAPGTNLGAATPVAVGAPGLPSPLPGEEEDDDESRKQDKDELANDDGEAEAKRKPARKPGVSDKAASDASAYIRSLAQMRGRNVDWAEKAVREAESLSAAEAEAAGVIDLVADDVDDLLAQLDGRTVTLAGQTRTLATAGAAIDRIEPDWRTNLLALLTNPNVAYVLMLVGIYGLLFEFYSPGLIGPGIIGAICLLLALYSFHVLPVNYAGLALTLLGLALIIAETLTPSVGVLGIGGLAAFVIGSVMLIDTDVAGFEIAWQLTGSIALVAGGVLLLVLSMLVRTRKRAVVSGVEEMIGGHGVVVDWSGATGHVRTHGEIWKARSESPLRSGARVRVTAVDGLTVDVVPDRTER